MKKRTADRTAYIHIEKGALKLTDGATGESLGTFDSMAAALSFCNEKFILVEGFTGGRFDGVFVPGTFQALRECFKGWKTPGRNMVKACNAVSLEAFKSEIRMKIMEAALGHYKALKGEIKTICGG